MATVFRVKYQYATPCWDKGNEIYTGWIDQTKIVKTTGDDAAVAVEMVKKSIMSCVHEYAPKNAPINTVRGFKLKGVEFMTVLDTEEEHQC